MLPKKIRLTKTLFEEIIASGRIFHSPALSLKAIKVSHDAEIARKNVAEKDCFAVVAPKRYFKTAVLRNKIRRRTYVALATIMPYISGRKINTDAGFYCIITLKPEALKLDQTGLRQAIQEIFVKSRIIT